MPAVRKSRAPDGTIGVVSIQIAVQPKAPPANDRIIVVYNAGDGSSGVPGAHLHQVFRHARRKLEYSVQRIVLAQRSATVAGPGRSVAWLSRRSQSTASSVKVIWMDNRASPGGNYTLSEFQRHGPVRHMECPRAQQRERRHELERRERHDPGDAVQ